MQIIMVAMDPVLDLGDSAKNNMLQLSEMLQKCSMSLVLNLMGT